ncbi:hypothetical protein J31TS6_39530 [Brevibacillus reuszeri]|nr:hypothetical protein J31TS6_39530 [Brevibacillus reuszeri]
MYKNLTAMLMNSGAHESFFAKLGSHFSMQKPWERSALRKWPMSGHGIKCRKFKQVLERNEGWDKHDAKHFASGVS